MAENEIESLRATAAQFKKLAKENPMSRGVLEQRAEEIETMACLMEQVPKIKPAGHQSQVDKKLG